MQLSVVQVVAFFIYWLFNLIGGHLGKDLCIIHNQKDMLQIINQGNQIQSFLEAAIKDGFEKYSPKTATPPPEIINGHTLRQRLDISEPTLIRWRQKGKIPYLQIGSAIRYDWAKVLESLTVQRKGL